MVLLVFQLCFIVPLPTLQHEFVQSGSVINILNGRNTKQTIFFIVEMPKKNKWINDQKYKIKLYRCIFGWTVGCSFVFLLLHSLFLPFFFGREQNEVLYILRLWHLCDSKTVENICFPFLFKFILFKNKTFSSCKSTSVRSVWKNH